MTIVAFISLHKAGLNFLYDTNYFPFPFTRVEAGLIKPCFFVLSSHHYSAANDHARRAHAHSLTFQALSKIKNHTGNILLDSKQSLSAWKSIITTTTSKLNSTTSFSIYLQSVLSVLSRLREPSFRIIIAACPSISFIDYSKFSPPRQHHYDNLFTPLLARDEKNGWDNPSFQLLRSVVASILEDFNRARIFVQKQQQRYQLARAAARSRRNTTTTFDYNFDLQENESSKSHIPFQNPKYAIQNVGPAVVRIDIERYIYPDDDDFADDETEQQEQEQQISSSSNNRYRPPPQIEQEQGSGFVVSRDGLVLTNAHLFLDAASRITVKLGDGRVFDAEILGMDEIVDFAVLRIKIPPAKKVIMFSNWTELRKRTPASVESSPLPVADLGDSDKLKLGQSVIALGSPGGLDNTATAGIVSGLARSSAMVGIPDIRTEFIQTDATINPGNSGGPLVDVETGKVVAINSCMRSNMEGTSFAIPINSIRDSINPLANGQSISHGFIGVEMSTCSREWALEQNRRLVMQYRYQRQQEQEQQKATENAKFQIRRRKKKPLFVPVAEGAFISQVGPSTPAHEGGLKPFDVIVEVNGKAVQNSHQVKCIIDKAPIGSELKCVVRRQNYVRNITIRPKDLALERQRQAALEQERQLQIQLQIRQRQRQQEQKQQTSPQEQERNLGSSSNGQSW